MVSIWFLIGLLLVAYGILILSAGVYEYFSPPSQAPVLAGLHAAIWWGLVVLAIGAFYCWRFQPRKTK
ncbi:MAG TPA: hypothetical protein VLY24_13280 [Bryobacteraceae bacterium]|nr:hypothetical protein [Bryobacteraceae bacterium]